MVINPYKFALLLTASRDKAFLVKSIQAYSKHCTLKSIVYTRLTMHIEISTPNNPGIHSFIHFGHFYSAPSSPLLLRGAPDYCTDTVSEFHAEAHRQLQVKDLPKVPTWRLEWESNPRPSG